MKRLVRISIGFNFIALSAAVILFSVSCKVDGLLQEVETILKVPQPSLSLDGGTYTEDTYIGITSSYDDALIYYTLDGSDPTRQSSEYTEPIIISGNGTRVTVKAAAWRENMQLSDVVSATYTISYAAVGTPSFSPAAGSYSTDQNVTISSTTPGATIYYTDDGTTQPDRNAILYTGPITLVADGSITTISAVAVKEGRGDSQIATATYMVDPSLATYTLTVNRNPAAGGTTVPSPSDTARRYIPKSIEATPAAGYQFDNWTITAGAAFCTIGNASSASTTAILDGGDATVRANFSLKQYTLTVSSGGNGTVSPSGGTTVTHGVARAITATPSTGYQFAGWTVLSGAANVTIANMNDPTTTATCTGDASIQANFSIIQYNLTMNVGEGAGNTSPSGTTTVDYGEATSIQATPASGYQFRIWSTVSPSADIADPSSSSTTATLIGGNATVTANFQPIINKVELFFGTIPATPVDTITFQLRDSDQTTILATEEYTPVELENLIAALGLGDSGWIPFNFPSVTKPAGTMLYIYVMKSTTSLSFYWRSNSFDTYGGGTRYYKGISNDADFTFRVYRTTDAVEQEMTDDNGAVALEPSWYWQSFTLDY